ncbi:MAG: flavin reductase family protein [Planctomycetaceae bacterium]
MSEQVSDAVATVLGRVPSGLFILVAGDAAGRQTGMLASWVQQASFDPPSVTVAVKRGRYLNDWLLESPRVVINVLGESQKKLLGHFARGFEPGEPAFEGQEVAIAGNGLNALAAAIGWLEGTVTGHVETGDHTVYVVQVTARDRGRRPAVRSPGSIFARMGWVISSGPAAARRVRCPNCLVVTCGSSRNAQSGQRGNRTSDRRGLPADNRAGPGVEFHRRGG